MNIKKAGHLQIMVRLLAPILLLCSGCAFAQKQTLPLPALPDGVIDLRVIPKCTARFAAASPTASPRKMAVRVMIWF